MCTKRKFTKATGAKSACRLLNILLVAVLLFGMVCGLGGCKKKKPTSQETAPAVTEVAAPTESPETKPVETKPAEIKPAEPAPAATEPAPVTTEPAETTPAVTEPATSNPTQSGSRTYTVIFQDYDGTVLKTQTVKKGKAATAPANPTRENYTFVGWDKSFDKVTTDLVVVATYTTTKVIIYAESVIVDKGAQEVTVNIRVKNNPGIMGAVLKVSVDDATFSFKEAKKTQYPGLTLTASGSGVTKTPYTFLLDALELSANDRKDGVLFSVTFNIKNPEATGKFKVNLSCDTGAIFDENYNNPNAVLENGTITIK